MTRRFSPFVFAAPLVLGLAACATDADTNGDLLPEQAQMVDASVTPADAGTPASDASTPSAAFTLTSPVFQTGVRIPDEYRCNSAPSPELKWTPGPAGTKGYALLFQDQANKFYHWVIYDIPATAQALPKGIKIEAAPAVPKGAKQGPNYRRATGYNGPCASANNKDRPYTFTLYALDVETLPGLTAQSNGDAVLRAIEAHDLASTKLNIISVGG